MSLAPRRELTLLPTAAIIIGSVIGSGVFINLPIVARFAGTPWMSVAIWFAGGLLWIPQIMILAEIGTAYPDQGGPYAYLVKAGSPLLGFLYTWTAFLTSDTPSMTIVGLSAASALSFFFPLLTDPMPARVFAAALIIVLAAIQVRSVRTGSAVQLFLTSAKLLPLFLLIVLGFFHLGSGNLSASQTAHVSTFNSFSAGISATLWSYAGFLNILYMAGEVREPRHTLPAALMGSIALVMAAYTLISMGTSAIVPFSDLVAAQGQFINPFKYLGFFGNYAGGFLAIAAFVSMVGALNALVMTQPRLEYAIARDGLFFRVFGHLHPVHATPDYAIVIQSGLAICLFLLGDIENMLGYFTLSYVLQNALVYGTIFFLRRRPDYNPSYRTPAWALMTLAAILIQLYIAYGTLLAYPAAGIAASFGLIVSGVPVYLLFRERLKSERREEPRRT